jgi:regulator of protease activity HflC (stomatin/prohibitin superfamily)
MKEEMSAIAAIEKRLAAVEIAQTGIATDIARMKPAVAEWETVSSGAKWFRGLAIAIAVLVFVVITIAKGVRLVAQGEEWVVERLGKYHATLRPGLNILIPYLDKVAYKLVTKDIILDVQEQEVITRDNAVILTNAIAFVKVTDPVKAVYGVTDFSEAIRNLIMTTLRSIVGEMELDEALSSRDKIKARLRESIADEAVDWGLTVKSVEIQDIKPSQSMQKAMEMQAAAERERKAVVTRSEGAKQSAILEAEARLESAKRDANAQVMLAEASAEAIRRITAAIGDQTGPMSYMLGEKYIAALERMGEKDNAKLVVLPADLQEAVRGLFGRKG